MKITHCDICQQQIRIEPPLLRETKTAVYSDPLSLVNTTLQVQVQVRRGDGTVPDLCSDCVVDVFHDAFKSTRAVEA